MNAPPTGSRATTTAELDALMETFWDEAAYERGLAFQPRPSDIIISPYAKCGTTWLQQIAHGLRTGGSMDFEEITAVTPWIEVAHDVGWDLEADHEAEPRVFKSHLGWHDIPKGARYMVSFRHYHDAFVSFYRFFEGWFFEPGSISLQELLAWRWPREEMDSKGYWHHLASWWEQRDRENVLLFCYEDMKEDLPGTAKKVARFMGIEPDPKLLDRVVRQSSRDFMLAHREQFDGRHVRNKGIRRAGLPPPIDSDKVTAGPGRHSRYRLSQDQKDMLDEIWREQIGDPHGLADYEALRRAVRALDRPG